MKIVFDKLLGSTPVSLKLNGITVLTGNNDVAPVLVADILCTLGEARAQKLKAGDSIEMCSSKWSGTVSLTKKAQPRLDISIKDGVLKGSENVNLPDLFLRSITTINDFIPRAEIENVNLPDLFPSKLEQHIKCKYYTQLTKRLDGHHQINSIIKRLFGPLSNCVYHLKEATNLVVIYYPENSLHPKWQVLLAELLVLIQRFYNLRFVVLTYSVHFINAVEVFSKLHHCENKRSYYNFDDTVTDCSDFESSDIFDSLAAPLTYLNEISR